MNCYIKLNHIISITSKQNLIIYDSINSYYQDASNCSVFMSLNLMDQMLFSTKNEI
ncbi:hypothetical protein RhiirA4_491417 [Rhizophagus irregularis]|uniref:Uncharacterized protein n=1 Tax=Rhizophagus irregularis TaxID=588596 RepID=A0A2I1HWI9_9GLOM|nr:hypothetical protein RhiirA4_491417 [Rhizophagus irregularis]